MSGTFWIWPMHMDNSHPVSLGDSLLALAFHFPGDRKSEHRKPRKFCYHSNLSIRLFVHRRNHFRSVMFSSIFHEFTLNLICILPRNCFRVEFSNLSLGLNFKITNNERISDLTLYYIDFILDMIVHLGDFSIHGTGWNFQNELMLG